MLVFLNWKLSYKQLYSYASILQAPWTYFYIRISFFELVTLLREMSDRLPSSLYPT